MCLNKLNPLKMFKKNENKCGIHGKDCGDNLAKALRDEILGHLDKFYQFTASKILFVTALIGLSAGNPMLIVKNHETALPIISPYLVLIAPFVGYIYDIFIINEKVDCLRIGTFFRTEPNSSCPVMKNWEKYVNHHRTLGPAIANLLLNIIVFAGTIIIFRHNTQEINFSISYIFPYMDIYIDISMLFIIILFLCYILLRQIIQRPYLYGIYLLSIIILFLFYIFFR